MAITAKKGAVTKSLYDVSGATLAAVWSDIQKKGPKTSGKTTPGLTTCNLKMQIPLSNIEYTTKQVQKEFESEAKMAKGDLVYNFTIKMPKLKSDKGLSAAAKTEWTRFINELEAHENLHVTDYDKEVAKMGTDIDALRAKGKGADKKKAEKAALAEYTKVFTKQYNQGGSGWKGFDGSTAAVHASSGHGPNLDVSIK